MTRFVPRAAFSYVLAVMAVLAGGGLAGQSLADGLPAPDGPVLLTVAGTIARANRGPFDPVADAFLAYHEKDFEAAAEFDRAMLESLGVHEIELAYAAWPKAYRFAGPQLADVLAAVGAEGRAVTVTALDGYVEEIPAEALAAHDWIVALERDGRPLGIGGHGPLWIVYAVPGTAASEADEARWPWAAFFIEVH